jgi:hypothetical protein
MSRFLEPRHHDHMNTTKTVPTRSLWVISLLMATAVGCGETLIVPVTVDAGRVSCAPATCESLGAECGMQGDGCGGTIACGDCSAGETCGAGGPSRCGIGTCTPTTCATLGATCGPVGDGCGGVLECGTCVAGEVCGARVPNRCAASPSTDGGRS